MEPNNNNTTSNLDAIIEGITNGGKISLDIFGSVYSVIKNTKTIGGSGLRNLDLDGNRMPRVDYNSLSYKGSKVVGMLLGFSMQIYLTGIPQGMAILVNGFSYFYNQERGKENFPDN